MIYFSVVAFEVSKKKPFQSGITCFSPLLLWRSILQTISLSFDIKPSNWLRSFSKFRIGNGFGRCLLLMYSCSSCETGLNERRLLVERSEVCDGITWNSCLLVWMTIPLVQCKVTLHVDSALWSQLSLKNLTNMPGLTLFGTYLRAFLLSNYSSANVVSLALISFYENWFRHKKYCS